ncbi:MAG: hypothetical protein ACRENI_06325 [Gemmatimonadaceae bacterium]
MTEHDSEVRDAAVGTNAEAGDATAGRRHADDPLFHVRASDLEPYTGLRYLSKLFRIMAVLLVLLLIAEVVTGFRAQGTAAIPTLLGESSRLIVLAGLLWGTGDLAILLIDVGHDVRAARIFVGRQALHHDTEHKDGAEHSRAGEPSHEAAGEHRRPDAV